MAMNSGLPDGRINALMLQTDRDRHYLVGGALKGGVWRYLIADLQYRTYFPMVFIGD